MKQHIVRFLRDEQGATAIEYGLIMGTIALALLTVLQVSNNKLIVIFQKIADTISGV